MEQIYYTQCPIGYGLGASNGFQIKRVTPGYSLSSDFRHLGLRAFPAGGRTLAPPSLRYRHVEGRAEVAWLTPRPQEYETERGLWGRPGGHFAHGIVLDSTELAAIGDWPAGLFDRPFWRRSDPEPSRGRLPEPVEIAEVGAFVPANFEGVASLAVSLDRAWLATLLTALALAAREGRTLFLVDEPERLGAMVGLLTFLFPPPLRADLTFSTYHDRPEELPGYRLHGTTAAARPNRAVLLTQGLIADVKTKTIEPRITPAGWSLTLVDWFSTANNAAWSDFARHVAQSDGPTRWDGDQFDRLIRFGQAQRTEAEPADWSGTVDLLHWATALNLANDWIDSHPPSWWIAATPGAVEGRTALITVSSWPESWRKGRASGWGRAVGRWFAAMKPAEIEAAILTFAGNAPNDRDRIDFLLAVRREIPGPLWNAIRRRIHADGPVGPSPLDAIAVPEAIASAIAGDAAPLREIARTFDRSSASALFLLGLVETEADGDQRPIPPLGAGLVDFFERPHAFQWALSRNERAGEWLSAFLRPHLATPDPEDRFVALLDATPVELRPTLARIMLDVASDPGLRETVFTDAVEARLLALPDHQRPHDPAWPGRYLDRSLSDYDLIRRLHAKGTAAAALRAWLKLAGSRGELDSNQQVRVSRLHALARTLNPRDPGPIDAVDLRQIPGRDRGPLLARWLGQTRPDPARLLDQCGTSWTESLRADSPDLVPIARAVAESSLLTSAEANPETWLHRLVEICRNLDTATPESSAFGPDGLLAQVVAVAVGGTDRPRRIWSLLEQLLNDEAAWKTIAIAFRLDLERSEPSDAAAVVGRWDKALYQRYPSRFWEIALNVCDGRRLAAVVQARASDLQSLGPLAWWNHRQYPDASNDIRDAFARRIPLAPLDENALSSVQNWMDQPRGSESPPKGARPWISTPGLARWTCIDHLTKDIFRDGLTDQTRRFSILEWVKGKLPLSGISEDDGYQLVAWVVFQLDDPSALDFDRVAYWLVKSGLTEPERITAWAEELRDMIDVPDSLIRDRQDLAAKLRREMTLVLQDERERAKIHET
jgi:hypothetical protein